MPTEPTVLSPWVRRTVRAAWVVACMGAASVPATTTVTMMLGAAPPGHRRLPLGERHLGRPRPGGLHEAAVMSAVDHPPHYGGEDDPYEAIKVIEAWKLGFNLGNTVKYIRREGTKGVPIEDLEKARWYLDREIMNRKKGSI